MVKLDTILNAYLVDGIYYKTDKDKLVDSIIPDNIAYNNVPGGVEYLTTSMGWNNMDKELLSYKGWMDRKYPIPYLIALYTNFPELPREGVLDRELRIMYFDIEVSSDGTGKFPRAVDDPMLLYGYAINDGEPVIDYVHDIEGKKKGTEDFHLVQRFINAVEKEDPDIIVSYNGWGFDVPYIATRARQFNLDITPLVRAGGVANASKIRDLHLYNDKLNASMGSRLHYDIYKVDVLRDQSLSGIKDRKMKTLGKHFLKDTEDEIIELDDGITNTRRMFISKDGLQRLIKYQRSDVLVTRGLSNIYLPQTITMANELNLPLGILFNRSPGTIPTAFTYPRLLEHNIIPDAANEDNFNYMYDLIKENPRIKNKERKSYQGAYVDIYKTGKQQQLWKIDVKSMYPNIIRTFNLSFETILFGKQNIMELEPGMTWRDLRAENVNGDLKLHLPDLNYNRILDITIDTKYPGILPEIIAGRLDDRAKIKEIIKTLDPKDPEYIKLGSLQLFAKIVANSIYGIIGARHSIGYLPIGFTITGLGRHMIKKIIEFVSEPRYNACEGAQRTKGEAWSDEWKATNPVIEIDTDGIIINAHPKTDLVNELITKHVKEFFGIDKCTIEVEQEDFGKGYFHGMKNYIILNPDGSPTIHGSFFKSSRSAPIIDRAIQLFIDHELNGKYTPEYVKNTALDFSNAKTEDFKIKIRMAKDILEYKGKGKSVTSNSLGFSSVVNEASDDFISQMIVKIARLYPEVYGFMPIKGDILEFLAVLEITTGKKLYIPYNMIFDRKIYTLDTEYYKTSIRKILEPVKVKNTGKVKVTSLF